MSPAAMAPPADRSLRAGTSSSGRLVVPAEVWRELRLNSGHSVVMDRRGEERRVRPLRRAVERAQALVRQYVPQDAHPTPSADCRAPRRSRA